jgi:hypothetical protein
LKNCVFVVLFFVVAASHAQDNSLYLRGGIVAIENQAVDSTSRWYATIRTSLADLRVECSQGPAKTQCSTMTLTSGGFVPSLLWTGGCVPIDKASSGSGTEEDPQITVWTCGGAGTGSCRIGSGYVTQQPTNAGYLAGVVTGFTTCQ